MRYILALLLLTACGGGGGNAEPNLPTPATYRTDLKYTYYGQMAETGMQLSETIDHINMVFASRWWGPHQQLAEIILATNAGIPVILDMPEPYQSTYGVNDPFDLVAAEVRVRARFAQLRTAGVLSNIPVIYMVDEPELYGWTAQNQIDTNAMMRRVMTEFDMTAKLAVVYSIRAFGSWPGIETYDWVGFDAYDAGTRIFNPGAEYDQLKAVLKPHQKIILVPGGCDKWRTDPTQFSNKAHQDFQVALVLPFVWRDNTDPANGAFAGIRSNGMAPAYKAVGLSIKRGH